jgi:hypothetical protein
VSPTSRKAGARAPKRSPKSRPGGDGSRPGRNLAESPIAWLFSRRDGDGNPLISEAEFNAGERLREDFHFAQMSPSVTQCWSASAGTGGGARSAPGAGVELADNVIAAAERVRRALAAVGPELAGVLIDVCCHLKGLETVERRAGWPQRAGKVVLRVALRSLARHYGLATGPRAAPRSAAVRHWGAPGYRPSLDAEEIDGPET